MVVGVVMAPPWTFVAPSSPRRGGVFSDAVELKEKGLLEMLLPVVSGWRRVGGIFGPCRDCGLTVADLALLLAGGDWSVRIWRLRSSLGTIPDPQATVICGHLCSFWRFIKP